MPIPYAAAAHATGGAGGRETEPRSRRRDPQQLSARPLRRFSTATAAPTASAPKVPHPHPVSAAHLSVSGCLLKCVGAQNSDLVENSGPAPEEGLPAWGPAWAAWGWDSV